MIVWELVLGTVPTFLIAMVPVFALGRFLIYRYFQRTPPGGSA